MENNGYDNYTKAFVGGQFQKLELTVVGKIAGVLLGTETESHFHGGAGTGRGQKRAPYRGRGRRISAGWNSAGPRPVFRRRWNFPAVIPRQKP